MTRDNTSKPPAATGTGVNQFLEKVARTPARVDSGATSRLLFGMDATASREATWDRACHLQGQMFAATSHSGDLGVQLCYYRGFGQFRASGWCSSADALLEAMSSVRCLGGHTQIKRLLEHAIREHQVNRLRAAVFVGDAVEEDADQLCHLAGKLGVLGVPLFMFQEGRSAGVKNVFQQMAQLSGGAWAPFDLNSASELKDLLAAVAVFATGGAAALKALEQSGKAGQVGLLTRQLKD